jgi:hypothetical protein
MQDFRPPRVPRRARLTVVRSADPEARSAALEDVKEILTTDAGHREQFELWAESWRIGDVQS